MNLKSFRYKNLSLFIISLICAAFLFKIEQFHQFILSLGEFGYLSAFLVGVLLVSTFTAPTAIIVLFVLAEKLSTIEIGIIAGFGSLIGDLVIFHYFKHTLNQELIDLYHAMGGHHLNRLLHLKYFAWTLPVIGAIIIASPLPDELGISLMGISRLKTYQFLLLSFVLNALGIVIILSASTFVKP